MNLWYRRYKHDRIRKNIKQITGAIQQAAIGFLALWKEVMTFFTSSLTSILGPSVANVERFLAAPKPPGNTKAYNEDTWI